MTTITSHIEAPMRYLSKGPEFFRSTSLTSQNSDVRRLSAAERLEADKLKYVKSTQVRQRRCTRDFYSSMISQSQGSTGTISSGCVSSSSPVNDDHSASSLEEKDCSQAAGNILLNRSITDVDIASKLRYPNNPQTRRPRPRSSTAQGVVSWVGSQADAFEKASTSNKTIENEKIKNSDESSHDCRKSRSKQSKSCCQKRSASVGSFTSHQREHKNASWHQNAVTMSPRTQLRQARQNLKKVKAVKPDENRLVASRNGQRQTAVDAFSRRAIRTTASDDKETFKVRQQSNRKPRPFSVIENINRFELSACPDMEEKSRATSKTSTKCNKDSEIPENVDGNFASHFLIDNQSKKINKRRSLDFSRTIDTNLHLPMSQNAPPSLSLRSPDSDKTMLTLHNLESDQKPWIQMTKSSEIHEPTFELKRVGQNDLPKRTSFQEEAYRNLQGPKKNISEALNKIINYSQPEDDIDTAYSSMSPDASTDSKTLMAAPAAQGKANSVAVNINNALNGRLARINTAKLREPSNTVQKQSANDTLSASKEHFASIGKSLSEQITQPNNNFSNTVANEKPIFRPTSSACVNRKWKNISTASSQPLNRIDLAPCASNSYQKPMPKSPMFAPSVRKEVAPESSPSNRVTLESAGMDKDGDFNTIKSHITMSTAPVDNDKLLFDTTASDLKSWRGRRSSVPQSVPIKPAINYAPNCMGNSKRLNNRPLSPTISQNLQATRAFPVSSSSTPYSSLKRSPPSSRSSSLKRNRPRSKSDASTLNGELDRFFSTMGMDESFFSLFSPFGVPHVSSESDFSFAGASAYVRDGIDDVIEADPATAILANSPAVSVIEKNARVMRWIMSCKKSMIASNPKTGPGRHNPKSPVVPQRPCTFTKLERPYQNYPPPIPARSYHTIPVVPIESDV